MIKNAMLTDEKGSKIDIVRAEINPSGDVIPLDFKLQPTHKLVYDKIGDAIGHSKKTV